MAEAQQSADKEPSLFSLLSRDAMIVFAALTLWAASDAWFQVTGLFAAELLSAADGIFVGYIVAAIFHEWGHYLGARVQFDCRLSSASSTMASGFPTTSNRICSTRLLQRNLTARVLGWPSSQKLWATMAAQLNATARVSVQFFAYDCPWRLPIPN